MSNNVRYLLAIDPTNKSGTGDPQCVLRVTQVTVIIEEPIEATGANDAAALRRARSRIAHRLGIPTSSIGT